MTGVRRRGSERGDWRSSGVEGAGRDAVGRVVRFCALVVVLAVIALGVMALRAPLERQRQLDAEIAVLEAERDEAAAERDEVQQELAWLKNNPSFIEDTARDELDLYLPGEVIFRIDGERRSEP